MRKAMHEIRAAEDAAYRSYRVGRNDRERTISGKRLDDIAHARNEVWIVLALQQPQKMSRRLVRHLLVTAMLAQTVKHIVFKQAEKVGLGIDAEVEGLVGPRKKAPRRLPGLNQGSVEIE